MEKKEYIKENDKIVLMCNYGFRDMTLNLLKCFEKLSIDKSRYILYCMDDKAYQFFNSLGIQSQQFSRDDVINSSSTLSTSKSSTFGPPQFVNDNQGIYGENAESYGNIGFRAICNEKPLVVLDVLKKGYNVLWTDTDIVWQRDPFIHFYQHINQESGFNDEDIDLYVQQDDDDICAGFYFIRSNQRTIKFIEDTISFLNPCIDDQIAMRLFLKSQGINIKSNNILLSISEKDKKDKIRYRLLDKKLFPNGTNYFNLKITQRDNITPFIIHNNCIIGHRSKKERFIEYGLWYISDEELNINKNNNNNNTNNKNSNNSENKEIKQFKNVLKNHIDIITSINSSDDGKLFTTSIDKSIKIWKYENSKENIDNGIFKILKSKYIHKRGGIWSTFIFSNNNNNNNENNEIKNGNDYGFENLLTSSHDKTIQYWNNNLDAIQTFTGHTGIINQLIVAPNSSYFFTCSDDNTIRQYDLNNINFKRVFIGHNGWVSSIAINKTSNILYSSSNDGTIRFWDINSGRCLNLITGNQGGWIRKIIYSDDLNILISGGNDGTIKIWNCDNSNNQHLLRINTNENSSINDLQFNGDTNLIYCAFENGSLKSFKLIVNSDNNNNNNHNNNNNNNNGNNNNKNNKTLDYSLDKIYQGHLNSSINCIHISKSLNLLFSGGFDKQIKSWEL
ncbi:hypothetical protein ACTA71_009000 [Dictyostelium dimigraforme]